MSEKKICFLISNNYTHDNRTRRQAECLADAGYKVTILCPAVAAEYLPRDEVVKGVRVRRVLDDWLPTLPKNKDQLSECRKYLEFALEEISDIYISKDLDTLYYGWKAALKHGAKLVYNADEYWQDLTLGGLGLKTKIYYKIVFYFLERFLARKADLVITVNESLAKMMQKNLGLKNVPKVILNAPEATKIVPNRKLKEDSGFKDKKIAIYVGIFSEGRGLENLIEASKYLNDDTGVVMLGYGNLKDSLSREISRNQVSDRVVLLEAVPYEELLSYISSADLGVIPILPTSTSHKYSLPNKFFEYILAGLPICASNLPVISGLISKYHIGETYEAGDASKLADTINSILNDPRRIDRYQKGLRLAKNELAWEVEKVKYLELIEGIHV